MPVTEGLDPLAAHFQRISADYQSAVRALSVAKTNPCGLSAADLLFKLEALSKKANTWRIRYEFATNQLIEAGTAILDSERDPSVHRKNCRPIGCRSRLKAIKRA